MRPALLSGAASPCEGLSYLLSSSLKYNANIEETGRVILVEKLSFGQRAKQPWR